MERLLEDAVTGQADVARALEGPGLRPRLEEDHLGTVDRVGLHACIREHHRSGFKSTIRSTHARSRSTGTWTKEQSMSLSRSSRRTTSLYTYLRTCPSKSRTHVRYTRNIAIHYGTTRRLVHIQHVAMHSGAVCV